ncbi:hypothetical protein F5888DRAFT_1053594 [Russula emetica]|nr:hypothetical protein F5888DRAFT_1053594 [Russula emetica]
MSTIPHPEASSVIDQPIANLLFDYPGGDIILRSQDSYHFRVPKTPIINSSPALGDLIRRTLDSFADANADVSDSLPVVPLPESGEILHFLLTFIFHVTPLIPSTHEEAMELLSVAQKYQMGIALTHIRGSIARQIPLPTRPEPALRIYALAQKHGLRSEALQTARAILRHSMTIEDFDNKLDIMPGASLYELWKYHEWVRAILASDLAEFRQSGARGTMTGLRCSSSQVPSWIDHYIESIGRTPNLFDLVEFNIAMTRHIKNGSSRGCECGSISSQTIHEFWEALVSVVHDCFKKAESALSLVQEREDTQSRINPAISPLEPSGLSDANFVIRSSDFVNFKVHKPVLAMASPFFKDLLSLHQPPDSESVDGLPVVQLSEDSELLSTLVSMLYHLRPTIPNSYDKVLYLLAACQKYEMASMQSYIRAEVSHGVFPTPKGAEPFSAYAIASSKRLVPEMENAARQTLDHPMTFEVLGEGLRLFEGWALRDLANLRKRYRDNLKSCFKSFLKADTSQSKIWTPCASYSVDHRRSCNKYQCLCGSKSYSLSNLPMSKTNGSLPSWLVDLFRKHLYESYEAFSNSLFDPRSIRGEYLSALQAHIKLYSCVSCTKVHTEKGEMFCKDLEDRLMQALNEALSGLISHR